MARDISHEHAQVSSLHGEDLVKIASYFFHCAVIGNDVDAIIPHGRARQKTLLHIGRKAQLALNNPVLLGEIIQRGIERDRPLFNHFFQILPESFLRFPCKTLLLERVTLRDEPLPAKNINVVTERNGEKDRLKRGPRLPRVFSQVIAWQQPPYLEGERQSPDNHCRPGKYIKPCRPVALDQDVKTRKPCKERRNLPHDNGRSDRIIIIS